MLNYNRLKISSSDYIFIAAIVILLIVGLTAIYSASYHVNAGETKANFSKQLIWILIGLVFFIVTVFLPTRLFYSFAYWLYGISIILLIVILILKTGDRVSRWIVIAGFQFQPSEIAKIGTLLALAKYLSNERRNLNKLKEILIGFIIVGVPFLLIAQQPDLGTSLVFLAFVLPVLYWAGMPAFFVFVLITPIMVMLSSFNYYVFFLTMIIITAVLIYLKRGFLISLLTIIINIGVGIATPLLWNQLQGYQKHRILTFLGLEIDPYGLSYQVIQSKVAIGSGGFWGKGLLNGTQTQLRFLPAQHTDFVFSVIGEELGFVGSLFIICLFLFIFLRCIYLASIVKNRFLSLVTVGTAAILGFHTIVNIGMTVGMMPVTGLPLPYLSYGGTFMVVSLILTGLIVHASIRRYKY